MTTAKTHIEQIVQRYIATFPDEFSAFKESMTMIRASLKDEEFGRALNTGSRDTVTRALYEMPETLYTMLIRELEEEEMYWLKAGGRDRKQGGIWFAKRFPEFAIPAKI